MYKVQTDQTNIPMDSLELPSLSNTSKISHIKQGLASPARSSATLSTARKPISSTATTPTQDSVVAKVFPALLPGPVLRPTGYSKRDISYTCPPSSPPMPSPKTGGSAFATPVARRVHEMNDTDSPLGSGEGRIGRMRREDEENLTSSVVKGRAASGLLELMRSM
jgi:hypothetical protein